MPRVPVPKKFSFSSLGLLSQVAIFVVLAALVVVGSLSFIAAQKHREQTEFTSVMAQSDAYSKTGQYTAAAHLLAKYLQSKHTPDHRYQALTSLGYAYQLSGQDDQAFATFKQVDAMQVKPANVYVLRALGYLSLQKGDRAAAIRYYTSALAAARLQSDPEITPYVPQWEIELKSLESPPSSPASS